MTRRATLKIALALASAVLLLPAVAGATHGGGYWFYQGYLPPYSGGPRTVHHEKVACCSTHWARISWAPCSHYMNIVVIETSGTWRLFNANNCDNTAGFSAVADISRGGCQNPTFFVDQPWVNCHWGTSP